MNCPKCGKQSDTYGIWHGRFVCYDCYQELEESLELGPEFDLAPLEP